VWAEIGEALGIQRDVSHPLNYQELLGVHNGVIRPNFNVPSHEIGDGGLVRPVARHQSSHGGENEVIWNTRLRTREGIPRLQSGLGYIAPIHTFKGAQSVGFIDRSGGGRQPAERTNG